jgi:hypothetical protein
MTKKLFDLLVAVATDEEETKEFIALISKEKEKLYSILPILKEIVGDDVDKLVDILQDYMAKKAMRGYKAYIVAGFTKEQAFSLTLATLGHVSNNIK